MQAVGYAKFSGKVGVCMATSGPGAIHLLNGLYDAKLDHVPVVAIVGQTERSAMGGSYQQEVDLQALFKDVASEYLVEVNVPEQLPLAIDRAIRTALTRRAPDRDHHPERPAGRAVQPAEARVQAGPVQPAAAARPDRRRPTPPRLARAAEVLNAGQRVAILVGQGARGAADEVARVADVLGAGVAKALLGKDVLSDELPFVTGSIGILGTRPSYELMRDCDTLLIVGSNFPYSQFLPEFGQGPGGADRPRRRADRDALPDRGQPRRRRRGHAARAAPAAVRPDGPRVARDDRGERRRAGGARWSARRCWTPSRSTRCGSSGSSPSGCRTNAIVAADSGSVANWYARFLKMRGDVRGSLSGTLATMGAAVPYAIGAKFAHPDRPAIALTGDGAMQMNGLAELLTMKRYAARWSDPRLITAVLHNNDLNQVTWELRAMGGAPKFEESQVLPDVSYADFARGLGLLAITVTSPDELGPAWEAALAADRPAVLDVHCDPEVPPIPPHAEFAEVKSMMQAMLKGDPGGLHLVAQGIKTKIQEALPGKD